MTYPGIPKGGLQTQAGSDYLNRAGRGEHAADKIARLEERVAALEQENARLKTERGQLLHDRAYYGTRSVLCEWSKRRIANSADTLARAAAGFLTMRDAVDGATAAPDEGAEQEMREALDNWRRMIGGDDG